MVDSDQSNPKVKLHYPEKGNSLNHTGFCGIMNMEKYMYKAGDIIDGT